MNLQDEIQKQRKAKEYNDEPVFYCKRCLSLRIMSVEHMEDSDFCDECNCNDIGSCSISEWETLYKQRYRHSFLEHY